MRDPWLGVTDFAAVFGFPLVAFGQKAPLHDRDAVFRRLRRRSDAVPPRAASSVQRLGTHPVAEKYDPARCHEP